jgi:NDP-sugar pyrophosphorylase family protein
MVIDYLKAHGHFGMRLEISREDDLLLDTGGGLKKASWFFDGPEPFLLHNVDVVSTVDLPRMIQFHHDRHALATLAVQNRKTSRYLYFDNALQLCGRGPAPDPAKSSLGFSGIHVISPHLLPQLSENGAFSIIPSYLRMAEAGEKILGFSTDDYYWMDLGKPENILQAERDLKAGLWPRNHSLPIE